MAASVSLPKIGEKPWFTLRAKASAAPSTKFSAGTVAAILGMANAKSAADNVVGPLRRLGILDDEGALTSRGNKWRVDNSYADACSEILESVYPDELAALTDSAGNPDRQKIATWLQHQGQGESNAKQMAATYLLIAAKTPAPAPDSAGSDSKKPSRSTRTSTKALVPVAPAQNDSVGQEDDIEEARERSGKREYQPSIHLDIQVHIPPAASADQIDQIFASMAKHLYRS